MMNKGKSVQMNAFKNSNKIASVCLRKLVLKISKSFSDGKKKEVKI